MMQKFTKIVATIGPASKSKSTLQKMHKAGMNIARLNLSHGSPRSWKKRIETIREVSKEIAILTDLKGPEIRVGDLENGEITLKNGKSLILTTENIVGNDEIVCVKYKDIKKVKKDTLILLDDGFIETRAVKRVKRGLQVKIIGGGVLKSNRKVTIRNHHTDLPFLSKQDKKDILFSIKNNVDYIAASFVRSADDIKKIRKILDEHKSPIRIIAKVEHPKAVDKAHEILLASDGLMVARGDLGVELPFQKIPEIQEDLIRHCNLHGQPVIVATQMLESMKESPNPTRAEVGDVAQAILQGTDAVMLSAETAIGKYPVRAVEMMTTIAQEYDPKVKCRYEDITHGAYNHISRFVTKAAYLAAEELDACIITPTITGFTARKISRFKPRKPILAVTPDMTILRQIQLSWGVLPLYEPKHFKKLKHLVKRIVRTLLEKRLIKKDDIVVVTSGRHFANVAYTNLVEVLPVKDV